MALHTTKQRVRALRPAEQAALDACDFDRAPARLRCEHSEHAPCGMADQWKDGRCARGGQIFVVATWRKRI